MATLTIKDMQGAEAGTLDVSDSIFAIEPNKSVVRQSLIGYEANQRQGTHSTKTRAYVSGGGKKPWRQKGTGRARQGSTRATQWRGGAICFGPLPRSYNQKINRKTRRLALASVLSDLRNSNRIYVVKAFELATPKTKEFAGILQRLNIDDGGRVLVLVADRDETVLLSARNIPNVLVTPVHNVNVFSLLSCDHLVTTPEGIKQLEGMLE